MPLYSYECLYCKISDFEKKFDVLQGMNDRPLQRCGGRCVLGKDDHMYG